MHKQKLCQQFLYSSFVPQVFPLLCWPQVLAWRVFIVVSDKAILIRAASWVMDCFCWKYIYISSGSDRQTHTDLWQPRETGLASALYISHVRSPNNCYHFWLKLDLN